MQQSQAMNQARSPTLPSFSGLSSAVNEAREYENNRDSGKGTRPEAQTQDNSSNLSLALTSKGSRPASISSLSETSADGFERITPRGATSKPSFSHGNSPPLLLQDTLTPLLDEVDALFDKSKEIVASLKAQGNRMQEDDVSEHRNSSSGNKYIYSSRTGARWV